MKAEEDRRLIPVREELAWAVHGLVGHNLAGVCYLAGLVFVWAPGIRLLFIRAGQFIHDVTIPGKSSLEEGPGR